MSLKLHLPHLLALPLVIILKALGLLLESPCIVELGLVVAHLVDEFLVFLLLFLEFGLPLCDFRLQDLAPLGNSRAFILEGLHPLILLFELLQLLHQLLILPYQRLLFGCNNAAIALATLKRMPLCPSPVLLLSCTF